ncbi:MAG: hypothetical protein KF876_13630, partial [Nitrospira sp.]|nr:hypothetical protein [Nitrospira sp.]
TTIIGHPSEGTQTQPSKYRQSGRFDEQANGLAATQPEQCERDRLCAGQITQKGTGKKRDERSDKILEGPTRCMGHG